MADVGVYRGGSTQVMAAEDSLRRRIDVFDTFCGLADTSTADADLQDGQVRGSSVADFRKALNTHIELVDIHVGRVEDTTVDLSERWYSLVNLDLDVYRPTVTSLKFFFGHGWFLVECCSCTTTARKRLPESKQLQMNSFAMSLRILSNCGIRNCSP